MKRFNVTILMIALCLILTSCGQSIKSFDDTIDSIRNNQMIVNCSEAANRGENKVNDIGYLCSIDVDAKTKLTSKEGYVIQLDDFSKGDKVRIILSSSTNIKKKMNFKGKEIKEIILLERAPKE